MRKRHCPMCDGWLYDEHMPIWRGTRVIHAAEGVDPRHSEAKLDVADQTIAMTRPADYIQGYPPVLIDWLASLHQYEQHGTFAS